jgi:predicted RNA polymerase sigma factor
MCARGLSIWPAAVRRLGRAPIGRAKRHEGGHALRVDDLHRPQSRAGGPGGADAATRRAGPYQVQAAIAALHCQAERAEATDWGQIAALYDELLRIQRSPIVALNRAVAVAMARTSGDGLPLLGDEEPASALERYHLYHAARADLLRRAGRVADAATAYRRALELATNAVERDYLERRLRGVQPPVASS